MGLISCSKSGNSNWAERIYHKPEVTTGQFRLVDNTGTPIRKRVVVFTTNIVGADTDYFAWYDLRVSANRPAYFTFSGSNVISTTFGPIVATNGRKYGISDTAVTDIGAASSGSEVDVKNTSSTNQTFSVLRNGHRIDEKTIVPNQTHTFRYGATFYIGGSNGERPELTDINTQINTLGVTSADVVMTKSGSNYVFTLANIT